MSAWKERGRRDLSLDAARLVSESVPRPDADVITFVPGDRDRGLRRGHVPAESLAAQLSEIWELPLSRLLVRRPGIERQRDLRRADRRRNVAGAFTAVGIVPRRVCVIDDVYTTGSTVTACATALRREGAAQVSVVCLARAVR
ncbi:hypothetical protein [Gaiella sp.]|uniref:ComF family protein n=1 Tax=Gaiella sp. TaxID=2663207 RepID=UPI00326589EC